MRGQSSRRAKAHARLRLAAEAFQCFLQPPCQNAEIVVCPDVGSPAFSHLLYLGRASLTILVKLS